MCTVSFVGDHYRDIWFPPTYPTITPMTPTGPVVWPPGTVAPTLPPEITRAEFDELKRQVVEMKELLRRAKIYDEANNQADCEMEDKIALIKKVAELVGVSLDDIIAARGA